MEKLFKNSKKWITSLGVVAFLMVAGWQVGADCTQEVFAETEVALENAVAESAGGGSWVCCSRTYRIFCTDTEGGAAAYYKKIDGATTCTGHEYD